MGCIILQVAIKAKMTARRVVTQFGLTAMDI